MHSFARRLHGSVEKSATKGTKGLILNGGWRYDLMGWFVDTFLFRSQWQQLRQKTIYLASLQPGERVLDVGCGTGTLALEAARQIGTAGRVVGIDPSKQQITRARCFPDRSDRAARILRSDVRCGALNLDDASLAVFPQTTRTRGNRPCAQTRWTTGDCRFQAQAGTPGPGCALSRRWK